MNKGGQTGTFGFALVLVVFLIAITTFAMIDPFKENLDAARDGNGLNCPGTANFNEADYNNDTDFEKLVRRPTCFSTGLILVYFVGAVLIASMVWLMKNWGIVSR